MNQVFQSVLRYLGWDEETERLRRETKKNVDLAEKQLSEIRIRLEETSSISRTGNTALNKALNESDFGNERRRAADR